MKKIILIIFLVVVVLLVAGVLIVGTHLGAIVKAGLETAGPKITQTTLKVDSVNLSLLGGSAGVNGLVLGNPEGFTTPQAISIGKAAVSLTPASILSDKIIIHSVEIRDAEITFEGSLLGANNLSKLMDNVNAATASAAGTNAPAATTSSAGEKKPGKKLEVDDLLIAGAKVHASVSGIPGMKTQELDVTIPDIHFTDLGKGTNVITAAELTQKILGEIKADTGKALATAVTGLGKNISAAAKNAVQDAASGALTNAGGSVEQLKKGLGGLLGK